MPEETGSASPSPRTFELGLVLAGAASAGAYTAGVMDFLFQALDEWQRARERGEALVPPHRVLIRVMAGASAGAMTAGILAATLGEQSEPVTQVPPPHPVRNKLYNSWIESIDIAPLLEDQDLRREKNRVASVLDSTVLDRIANDVFDIRPDGGAREYIADELHVLLSVANLRGVPYRIELEGSSSGHVIYLHKDHMHFLVGSGPAQGGRQPLDPLNPGDPGWQLLAQAALASGAFPLALVPRVLSRRAGEYAERRWPVPQAPGEDGCERLEEISPDWPLTSDSRYDFLAVDGGLMDNEPLELARRILAGKKRRNERGPGEVSRAVLMVDPFPDDEPFDPEEEQSTDLHQIAIRMFSGLRSQTRFKPEELVLAAEDDVYSRFMIAPTRREADGEPAQFPMASSSISGFGGFFCKEFREHDFQLGRRNCQRFLQRYFALPEEEGNPLFADWSPEVTQRFRFTRDGRSYLPIIPLLGSATAEVPALDWPRLSADDFDTLRKAIGRRTNAVVQALINQHIAGRTYRIAARTVWWGKRAKTVQRIVELIRDDLRERRLLQVR